MKKALYLMTILLVLAVEIVLSHTFKKQNPVNKITQSNSELIRYSLKNSDGDTLSADTWSGQSIMLYISDSNAGNVCDSVGEYVTYFKLQHPDKFYYTEIGAADLRQTPRFFRWFIPTVMKKQNNYKNILLDWDGIYFDHYNASKHACNILFFDESHQLEYRTALIPPITDERMEIAFKFLGASD